MTIINFFVQKVHLHGHKFEVLKVGFPTWSGDCTVADSLDIRCSNNTKDTYGVSGCRAAKFVKELNALDLDLVYPPLKDTVVVPQHG